MMEEFKQLEIYLFYQNFIIPVDIFVHPLPGTVFPISRKFRKDLFIFASTVERNFLSDPPGSH